MGYVASSPRALGCGSNAEALKCEGPLHSPKVAPAKLAKDSQERNIQQKAGKTIRVQALLGELKACGRTQDLQRGKRLHAEAVKCGHGTNLYILSALIQMYAKCVRMVDARRVFHSIDKPDAVCWNALLLGYAESREGLVALDLFSAMKASGCVPSSVTYLAVLKACASLAMDGDGSGKKNCLQRGRQIHSEIGSSLDRYVHNALIDMYTKCGSMIDAQSVFDSMHSPDAVSWTTLLLGMKASGCTPNTVTYVAALKACTSLAVNGNGSGRKNCLQWGREIHSEIGSNNISHHVQSTLIDMYAKCGSIVDARRVFDSIQKPNVACWNALMLGYAENGEGLAAMDLFSTMKVRGCALDSVSYLAALKACTSLALDGDANGKKNCLKWGRDVHSEAGTNLDQYVQSTLIDMYAKCGSMVEARHIFDSMYKPDVVSWTALLLGYAENGEGLVALDLFSRMKASECAPNSVTYVAALKACTSLAMDGDGNGRTNCLERGREIHSEIGSNMSRHVQSALIDMYAKCGSIVDAHRLFDSIEHPDVVCWNALLLGCAESGEGFAALDTFSIMKASRCTPNSLTYVAALKACGLTGALALGRKLQYEITDFVPHVVTCLVDFYGKCGSIVEAHEVFGLHPKARDITTWNALLAGYGRFGDFDCVFNLFEAMQDEGFQPDAVTFVQMLSCCSHAGLVEKARYYFEGMDVRYGVTPTVMHYNCMIDVLGRANLLNETVVLLLKMPCKPGAVTWMTLLGACHKWKNVQIGSLAFQSLVDKDESVAAAYVLMAQVYGSRGMWEEQERVLELKTRLGLGKFKCCGKGSPLQITKGS